MSEQCRQTVVIHDGLATYRHQCNRKGKVQEDAKWWCTQHSPAKVAERRQKSQDEYDASRMVLAEQRANEAYNRAAGDLCRKLGLGKEELTRGRLAEFFHRDGLHV